MTDLQTNKSLLKKLHEAASQDLTVEELRKQRVSYVMGILKDTSSVTREQVQNVLAHQEGKKSAA